MFCVGANGHPAGSSHPSSPGHQYHHTHSLTPMQWPTHSVSTHQARATQTGHTCTTSHRAAAEACVAPAHVYTCVHLYVHVCPVAPVTDRTDYFEVSFANARSIVEPSIIDRILWPFKVSCHCHTCVHITLKTAKLSHYLSTHSPLGWHSDQCPRTSAVVCTAPCVSPCVSLQA